MPAHAVHEDLASAELVELEIKDAPPGGIIVPMSAIYQVSKPPGSAGR